MSSTLGSIKDYPVGTIVRTAKPVPYYPAFVEKIGYEEVVDDVFLLLQRYALVPLKYVRMLEIEAKGTLNIEDGEPLPFDRKYNSGVPYICYAYCPTYDVEPLGKYGEFDMSTWADSLVDSVLKDVTDLESLMETKSVKPDVPAAKPDKPKPAKKELLPGQKWFSELFGFKPKVDFGVTCFEGFSDVPERNESYIFPREETEELVRAIEKGWVGNLVGLPGTGKTEWCANVAAITGRPFLRIHYNMNLEPEDILGKTALRAGETRFIEGDLPKFIRQPALILHDEWTRASSGIALSIFQSHLEDGSVKLEGADSDKRVLPHPHLAIMMADNTLGLGDNLDKFAAANVQDTSTINRIGRTAIFNYLPEAEQAKLAMSISPSMPEDVAKKLAKFAVLCQTAYTNGEIPLVFSTRNLKSVAEGYEETLDLKIQIKYNYLNALDKTSSATVAGFMRTVGI